MRTERRCVVNGCPGKSHAKGMCRRHYGQVWRRGYTYESPKTNPDTLSSVEEAFRSCERELKKAQQMYDVVVGLPGRLHWRREIERLQKQGAELIEKLQKAEVPCEA